MGGAGFSQAIQASRSEQLLAVQAHRAPPRDFTSRTAAVAQVTLVAQQLDSSSTPGG
jgi:hypothetical protein